VADALQNLRVVDFSRVLAGPLATLILADFGATVTKIERPGVGDDTRSWGPPCDDRGMSTYFQCVNRNKASVALDLGSDEDVRYASKLIGDADIVVENFRPGVMEGFGLDYDAVSKRHPGIVYCSITGFGAEADLQGYDLLVQALGGLMSITGPPDGGPQKVGAALVDVIAGLYAASGILIALRHRDQTGQGQHVEVDLLSSLLAGLVNRASGYTVAHVVPGRMGNSHPSIAPYDVYAAADGEFILAVGNDRQFQALCSALGDPVLARDPLFAANSDRVAHRQQLRERLEARFRTKPVSEWAEKLPRAGVPAGQINDIAGAYALATSLGLDPIVEVPRPDGSTVPLTRNPIRLSHTPATYHTAPPVLAERVVPAALSSAADYR
jgi:crotonobetainyl-CoA:carnitine CoA-transferase CaiB-like acyl-CoA transferase